MWDEIQGNDYLVFSCPCGTGPSDRLWEDASIQRLPEDDVDRHGRLLLSTWCKTHGEDYCAAILTGERRRADITQFRDHANRAHMQDALRAKVRSERTSTRARRRGRVA